MYIASDAGHFGHDRRLGDVVRSNQCRSTKEKKQYELDNIDFNVTRSLLTKGESYAQYLRRYGYHDWRVRVY